MLSRELVRIIAPITQGVRDVRGLYPVYHARTLSDEIAHVVAAQDELERQKRDRSTSIVHRALLNASIGATLGGVLGGIKTVPVTHKVWNPAVIGGAAAVGGATALAFTLARHALRPKLTREAVDVIDRAGTAARLIASHPTTSEKARDWEAASWAPYIGAEAGAIFGGIGSLGAAWALGMPYTTKGQWQLGALGAGIGGLAGLGLGYLYRKRKKRDFLAHVENEMSQIPTLRAQEAATESAVEQDPLRKAAATLIKQAVDGLARRPFVSTNAPLLRGAGGPPARYAVTGHGARVYDTGVAWVRDLAKQGGDDPNAYGEELDDVALSVCRVLEAQYGPKKKPDAPPSQEKPADAGPSQVKSAEGGAQPPRAVADAPGQQTKQADVAQFLPRREVLVFTPGGKLAVKRIDGRRFELPSDIEGTPVPYEQPVRFLPDAGVPEKGVHGYEVALQVADAAAPEGFEEVDPHEALKDLYAALGKPENKAYQMLDRARARAILRLLKQRQRPDAGSVSEVTS